MNVAFLKNFLTIVDAGSVAEAARRLNLSPTTLAQQMKSIEKDLGVKLVMRTGRTVSLTEAGHRVLEQARALVHDYSNMHLTANSSLPPKELRLGSINTALQSFIPDTLLMLTERLPTLSVFIHAGTSEKLLEDVRKGALDAVIIPHPQYDFPKSLCWQLLIVEPLIALVPARLRAADPYKILRTQPFIRYDRQHWGGQLADRYLKEMDIVPKERFELASLLTIALMVDRGLGVSLVPDSHYPSPPGLRLAKLPLLATHHQRLIGAVWKRGSPKEGLVGVVIDHIRSVLALEKSRSS
ncbi:LysR family transcriptional regulator [Allopusillimonas soli]|uniref:LysR family transcriptional regulator n=1 Tax=Allopusillimonas soli TaxID=659016 RepID=A0A853FER3_9BURK|nr:LysR family transcriptional regulator [Allopusillimonas soli]NYT38172.1 LysR family transcriptional regulator [Allopusillimonas soli]TEA74044.1 LysR family transcriptional regulator [Allopusillimonas soli]